MRVEFNFDVDGENITALEGVAVLFCFVDGEEDPVLLYGNNGGPTTISAVGMYSVALDDAKRQFEDADEED